jgi:VWFA-related protein
MPKPKRSGALVRTRPSVRAVALAAALTWVLGGIAGQSQAPAQDPPPQRPAQQGAQPAQPPPADAPLPVIQLPEQPTFRGGISFVRVDVIVTDGKAAPVTDLKQEEFEVLEDDQLQAIEQFRLIKVDGNPKPGEPPPRELRNRDDEESEAARDDVRVFAILLDDYHVRRANSISVREPLTRFITTQLRPNDMLAVMYPLQPASDVSFTRNHASIISAIERFEGRKYDYRPRNQLEENYVRYPTETVERIRNDVVMGALRGLSVRLGSLSERRKSIIFVSEGFTAMLPPQMRRADASMPADPRTFGIGSAAGDTPREETAAFFSQADVFSRLRDVFEAANRNNTAVYSLDPRGLAVFEFDLDDAAFGATPSFATDRRTLQMTTDTLRTLSEETDGRAIVNRNTLAEGLAQITRDSSYYYLLGYNSKAPTDGKFHQIKVRVKRRGVDVRARRGFWAATAADLERIANPAKEIAKPIQTALASIAPAVQASRYVRTWVGSQRGAGGKTKITVVWEPMPAPPGARRDPIASLSVLAADGGGNLVFRGRSGGNGAVNVGSGPGSVRPPSPAASAGAGAAAAPQQITFDAPPGKLELRLTVEGAEGAGTLDRENQTVEIPDFSAPQPSLSTPRVYRGRTARDMQMLQADAVPVITREFSRTERLLIRFDAYAPGTEQPAPTARLLNRGGDKMQDLTVVPATAGGTHQVDVGLNTIPPGEYLVELTVPGATGGASSLIAFRVGS